jgi:mono/diheme cytochrome c family protein
VELAVLAVLLAASAASAIAQTAPLARGRYLVTTIMACGNCHTPKDADGRPVPGKELAGGGVTFDIPPFAGTAPNITPDRETGIGAWSDDEIKRAITQGIGRDGRRLQLPMAFAWYAGIRDEDLDAIVAYLRTLPARPR